MKNRLMNKNGAVLVFTIIIFAVLMIFATFVLSFMVTERRQAIAHLNKTQGYYIARSGAVAVEAAILEMTSDEQSELMRLLKINNIDNIKVKGLEDHYSPSVSIELDDNNIIISSVVEVNNSKSSVKKVLIATKSSASLEIKHAIFSKDSIILNNGIIEGDIATNDSVIINGSPTLRGDIFLKEDKTITFPYYDWESNWRNGYGELDLVSEKDFVFFDFPEYPNNLQKMDNIKTNGDNNNPIIAQSGSYDRITIDQNYSLTIDTTAGDILIRVSEFSMPQGKIMLKGSNKVSIYSEQLYIGGGSTINYNNGFPGDKTNIDLFYSGIEHLVIGGLIKIAGNLLVESADLTITNSGGVFGNVYSNGKNVILSGSSDITRGLLYAPDANVVFSGSGKIFGAIVSKKYTLSGGGQVYYKPEFFDDDSLSIDAGSDKFEFSTPGYFIN